MVIRKRRCVYLCFIRRLRQQSSFILRCKQIIWTRVCSLLAFYECDVPFRCSCTNVNASPWHLLVTPASKTAPQVWQHSVLSFIISLHLYHSLYHGLVRIYLLASYYVILFFMYLFIYLFLKRRVHLWKFAKVWYRTMKETRPLRVFIGDSRLKGSFRRFWTFKVLFFIFLLFWK